MSNCQGHSHKCNISVSSDLHQSLDELEFERGIWAAAQSGDFDRLVKILNGGEDVNRLDRAGYTALHYAVRGGHYQICNYLLSHGANIDAITRAGSASALHRASTAGKLQLVELLLAKNANPYLKDADGKTALHRAAEKGYQAIYNLLIKHAPDLKDMCDNKNKLASDYIV